MFDIVPATSKTATAPANKATAPNPVPFAVPNMLQFQRHLMIINS
jgi:hypothetical protein